MNAAGDVHFSIGGMRHPFLVNSHGHDERAVLPGQAEHEVGLVTASFEVERVEDRPARISLQGDLEHIAFGTVEHQRRLD